ncbi:EamA family transporter [Actinoplanes solisilvae]|uniref:EamA family transporter n=1 Tax=Actinoplanes solisilvae TaxID=2486853 RepID=UPI0013E2AFB1|nr:EamA family transporter [Actinoplanes solisilvae]
MTAAVLAAVAWGLSDFLAGLLARRLPVLTILIGSKLAAMLLALVAVAVRGLPPPNDPRLLLGVAAGLVGLPAMGLLYRAMRDGSLAVVAPIAAVAALVPVVWGLLHGERLGVLAAVGVVVGLAGVTMSSWPVSADAGTGAARTRSRRLADLCAIGAALGFGVYFVLLHEAGAADQFWSVALARIIAGVAAVALAVVLARARTRTACPAPAPTSSSEAKPAVASTQLRSRRRLVLPISVGAAVSISVVGVADAVADAAFIVAAASALAPAAVVASLYPAITLLLSRSLLRERLHTVHLYGVLAALFAVACLAR